MATGPVQLIVLGFDRPDFQAEVVAELDRLRRNDTVRVIDALAVYKDGEGEVEIQRLNDQPADGTVEFGTRTVSAQGIQLFSDQDAWDMLADIPNDSAAALLLVEHHWAVPLREAVARAGGFRIGDGFVSPVDLVEIGLLAGSGPIPP
jgi:hypothetical protein